MKHIPMHGRTHDRPYTFRSGRITEHNRFLEEPIEDYWRGGAIIVFALVLGISFVGYFL